MKRLTTVLMIAILTLLLSTPLVFAGKEKVAVCHVDENGDYKLINIAAPAVNSHIAHGDALAGVDNLDENCEPVYSYISPAKTGQTACWDQTHTIIDCANTGQDGEYQYGSEPAVAPRAAGGWDFGGYDRTTILAGASDPGFTDNGDGTVTDNLTGLTWLKDARCLNLMSWWDALNAANTLESGNIACGLTDGSLAGEWRMPNYNEFRSLFDRNLSGSHLPSGVFTNVRTVHYKTSTTYEKRSYFAYHVHLSGHNAIGNKVTEYYVWPVRGGE